MINVHPCFQMQHVFFFFQNTRQTTRLLPTNKEQKANIKFPCSNSYLHYSACRPCSSLRRAYTLHIEKKQVERYQPGRLQLILKDSFSSYFISDFGFLI